MNICRPPPCQNCSVDPNHQAIEYKDIMHWKARATFLRNTGNAKAAKALEKAEALKEAKEADEDEDFMMLTSRC